MTFYYTPEGRRRRHKGEFWTEAQDERLLQLVWRARERRKPIEWSKISIKLGRTYSAVQTRYYALRAGMRLKGQSGNTRTR